MKFNWTTVRIGDMCEIKNGYAFKSKDFASSGVPVIKIKNVKPNQIIGSDFSYIPETIAEEKSKWLIRKGDILLTMTGNRADGSPESWVGKAALFTLEGKYLLNQRVAAITSNHKELDTEYLGYYLSSWESQLYFIKRSNSSGGQANISPDIVRDYIIALPPLEEQLKIVGILKAIDVKIKNNCDINDNLQQQVMALYRQMFIESANAARRECRADEYFDISIGKTPPRKEPQWFSENSADHIWVSISDMGSCGLFIANSSEYLTHEAVKKFNIKVVPDNTILLSFKLTVGRIAITDGEMTTNEAIAHFKTNKPEINEYLFCYLKDFNYQTMGSTSSIATAVNSKIIKGMPFVVPPDDELKTFHGFAEPIFAMIKSNQRENNRLAALRDTLLPKLMSGEIDVSAIQL
jgi:type I restriction enzyme S subunit